MLFPQTSPEKEKGRINLADVRAVEEVDSEALGNKPNAFQVSHRPRESNLPICAGFY